MTNKIKNPYGETERERELVEWALKEGAKHSVPSPETAKFMEKISMENAVIVTKLEGLLEIVKNNHLENKEAFEGVYKRQDHTNGNVTELQLKNAKTEGMYKIFSIVFSIILLPVIVSIITSYVSIRDASIRQTEYNKNLEEKINQMSIDHSKIEDEIKNQASISAKKEIEEFAKKNFNSYNK